MVSGVRFAAIGLDHAHVFGQLAGLRTHGAHFAGMSSRDPDSAVFAEARARWPAVPVVDNPRQLLEDRSIDWS